MEPHEPKTLQEAIRYFSDPGVALQTMVRLRWPNGVVCPLCGAENPHFLAKQRRWQCRNRHPGRQFSAKTGTVMEDSPLGLDKWFAAIWLICNAKNGISSYGIHRALGVTQKSAWFLLHRVRMAMKAGSFEKPGGCSSPDGNAETKEPAEFEADETFIGGQRKFMHKVRKEKLGKGRGTIGKEIVMGILARSIDKEPSRMVMAKRIPNTDMGVLQAEVRAVVEPGSHLYTDALRAYNGLSTDYLHEAVDHEIEYVKGRVHTNGMENFWSLFKRTLKGTYTHMSGVHLDRYVDEQAFRFNERKLDDGGRFRMVVSQVKGKRLTYDELTGRAAKEAKQR